jgi:enolase
MKLKEITALEILDSRGNPTLKVTVKTESGAIASAAVPSGASTGEHEAWELRDEDKERFGGKGVLRAINSVEKEIAPALLAEEWQGQTWADRLMINLDGTPNKSRLGANAILGVSLALARAEAAEEKRPLYEHLRILAGTEKLRLPDIMCNVINGGAHSDSGLDIQEYFLIPSGIKKTAEKIRALAEIYHKLADELKALGERTAVGDEGGFAPRLKENAAPLVIMEKTIKDSGYSLGGEIKFGLDVAASEFYSAKKNRYCFSLENKELTAKELIAYYAELASRYPFLIIEDGLAQDDWDGWMEMTKTLGEKVFLMGDDFTVTNSERLNKAIEQEALNSILIKPNQIGTLTETVECMALAREHGIKTAVSHRSGETSDDFIADLAVGAGADWLKIGSPARGERVAKYNRLLEIDREINNE